MADLIIPDNQVNTASPQYGLEDPNAGFDMSPTVSLTKVAEQTTEDKTKIQISSQQVIDNRRKIVDDFVNNLKLGNVNILDQKAIPTMQMPDQNQRLAIDQFKRDNGFSSITSQNPGALLDAIKSRTMAQYQASLMPSYLQSLGTPNQDAYYGQNPNTQTWSDNSINTFYNKYKGKTNVTSPEGGYPNQCVSIVRTYAKEAGNPIPISGNAYEMFANYGKNGIDTKAWQKVNNGQGAYRTGDIVFWEPKKGGSDPTYGHTAIVKSVNGDGTLTVIEGNWGGKGVQERKTKIADTAGVLRNAKAPASTPMTQAQPTTTASFNPSTGSLAQYGKFQPILKEATTNPVAKQIYNYFAPKYGDDVAKKFVVLSKLESGWRTDAGLQKGSADDSIGLYQINLAAQNTRVAKFSGSTDKNVNRKWLQDPINSARVAEDIYKSSGFKPWTVARKSVQTANYGTLGNGILDF